MSNNDYIFSRESKKNKRSFVNVKIEYEDSLELHILLENDHFLSLIIDDFYVSHVSWFTSLFFLSPIFRMNDSLVSPKVF